MPSRSLRRMRWGWEAGWIYLPPLRLRQRKAMEESQSGSLGGRGSQRSSLSRNAFKRCKTSRNSFMFAVGIGLKLSSGGCSGTVLRIDLYIFVRQIAGPHLACRRAASEHHAYADFLLAHYFLPVRFIIAQRPAAVFSHQNPVQ